MKFIQLMLLFLFVAVVAIPNSYAARASAGEIKLDDQTGGIIPANFNSVFQNAKLFQPKYDSSNNPIEPYGSDNCYTDGLSSSQQFSYYSSSQAYCKGNVDKIVFKSKGAVNDLTIVNTMADKAKKGDFTIGGCKGTITLTKGTDGKFQAAYVDDYGFCKQQ